MLFTAHALVGAAIAKATGNPYAGFLAGFLSHHIMDALPHFDQGSLHTEKRRALYLGDTNVKDNTLDNFNRKDWIMLFIDWMVSGAFFGIIFFSLPMGQWILIITGAAGGLAADIVDSSPLWSIKLREKIFGLKKYHWFHTYFHWTVPKKNWVAGLAVQMILATSSFLYLMLK